MTEVVPLPDILPITKVPRSGLPDVALVVGDPARAQRIADLLTDAKQVGANREYLTFVGSWQGTEVVVASHGVGGPGAICAFQELMDAGVRTLVRLGTAGAMAPHLADGDVVVAEAAVREDGVTDQLVPVAYPAVSTPEVVLALSQAAQARGLAPNRGIVWTRALFYPGFVPLATDAYLQSRVVAIEMELSALLVLAATRGCRSGGILVIDGASADDAPYNPHKESVAQGVARAVEVALDALRALSASP